MTWIEDARREREENFAEATRKEKAAKEAAQQYIATRFMNDVLPGLPKDIVRNTGLEDMRQEAWKESSGQYRASVIVPLDLGEAIGDDRYVDLHVYPERGAALILKLCKVGAPDHYLHVETLLRDLLSWVVARGKERDRAIQQRAEREEAQRRQAELEAEMIAFRNGVTEIKIRAWHTLHPLVHEVLGDTCPDELCDVDPWQALGVEQPGGFNAYYERDLGKVEAEYAAAAARAANNTPALIRLRERAEEMEKLPRDVTVYKLTYPHGAAMGEDGPEVDYRIEYSTEYRPDGEGWWPIFRADRIARLAVDMQGPGALQIEEMVFPAMTKAVDLPEALRKYEMLDDGGLVRGTWRAVKPLVEGP